MSSGCGARGAMAAVALGGMLFQAQAKEVKLGKHGFLYLGKDGIARYLTRIETTEWKLEDLQELQRQLFRSWHRGNWTYAEASFHIEKEHPTQLDVLGEDWKKKVCDPAHWALVPPDRSSNNSSSSHPSRFKGLTFDGSTHSNGSEKPSLHALPRRWTDAMAKAPAVSNSFFNERYPQQIMGMDITSTPPTLIGLSRSGGTITRFGLDGRREQVIARFGLTGHPNLPSTQRTRWDARNPDWTSTFYDCHSGIDDDSFGKSARGARGIATAMAVHPETGMVYMVTDQRQIWRFDPRERVGKLMCDLGSRKDATPTDREVHHLVIGPDGVGYLSDLRCGTIHALVEEGDQLQPFLIAGQEANGDTLAGAELPGREAAAQDARAVALNPAALRLGDGGELYFVEYCDNSVQKPTSKGGVWQLATVLRGERPQPSNSSSRLEASQGQGFSHEDVENRTLQLARSSDGALYAYHPGRKLIYDLVTMEVCPIHSLLPALPGQGKGLVGNPVDEVAGLEAVPGGLLFLFKEGGFFLLETSLKHACFDYLKNALDKGDETTIAAAKARILEGTTSSAKAKAFGPRWERKEALMDLSPGLPSEVAATIQAFEADPGATWNYHWALTNLDPSYSLPPSQSLFPCYFQFGNDRIPDNRAFFQR